MKKLILAVLAIVILGAGYYVYRLRSAPDPPAVQTMPLSRGDVIDSVGATGTLEAVETVDVGTQVSGVVERLYADFNSIVKRGQVIARLDPQLIQTQIEQQAANVARAEADLERLRVAAADAKQKLERAKQMSIKQLIPQTELETAEVNLLSAEAQIRSSEAGLTQARAQLNNQRVNLGYTTITAPIDGIVISRNVDQGQTVAASMNAPVLYVIAADLTKMQVVANIDEADVGRMRPGQNVSFRVDAYPTDQFVGTVEQVRLQPAVVQNVVTYSTVIAVPNADLKLKPGMTATVTIEVSRRDDVLRIPNRALAFRPTQEMFAVLNQEVPPELTAGRGGAGRGRGDGARSGASGAAPAASPGTPAPGAATPTPGAARAQQSPAAASPDRAGAGRPAAQNGPTQGRGGQAQGPAVEMGDGRGEGLGGRGQGPGGFDPNMTPEERQRRRDERMKAMTPEERAAFAARGGEGGRGGRMAGGADLPGRGQGGRQTLAEGTGARQGGQGQGPRGVGAQAAARAAPGGAAASGATTIDSLFAPIQVVERNGLAWLHQNNQLKPLRLRLGVSDGTFTEIVNSGEVPETTQVVVSMTTGLEPRAATPGQNQNNPLMGPQRGGPGGRGPGGGGGRGRG